jgi:Tfp pilus assembly protein PilF
MERRGFLATLFAIPAALALKPAVAPVKAEDWAADYFSRGITIPPFSEWERANPNLTLIVTHQQARDEAQRRLEAAMELAAKRAAVRLGMR